MYPVGTVRDRRFPRFLMREMLITEWSRAITKNGQKSRLS
jgi:hypothetical protein